MVRVIDQITDLVTKEALIEMPISDGRLWADNNHNLLKVAAIERNYCPGKSFVGFIRGLGLKQGSIATSTAWDCSDIIVAGTNEADMAQAVNRLEELGGGVIVCSSGKILAELALPFGGLFCTESMETIAEKLQQIQLTAETLGCKSPDIRITLSVLTTASIPYLRICEQGLVDFKQNKIVELIVD